MMMRLGPTGLVCCGAPFKAEPPPGRAPAPPEGKSGEAFDEDGLGEWVDAPPAAPPRRPSPPPPLAAARKRHAAGPPAEDDLTQRADAVPAAAPLRQPSPQPSPQPQPPPQPARKRQAVAPATAQDAVAGLHALQQAAKREPRPAAVILAPLPSGMAQFHMLAGGGGGGGGGDAHLAASSAPPPHHPRGVQQHQHQHQHLHVPERDGSRGVGGGGGGAAAHGGPDVAPTAQDQRGRRASYSSAAATSSSDEEFGAPSAKTRFGRKPVLQGRFSGRLNLKADERRLVDECRALGPYLGGWHGPGDAPRNTLASIVRSIASGDILAYCQRREDELEALRRHSQALERSSLALEREVSDLRARLLQAHQSGAHA